MSFKFLSCALPVSIALQAAIVVPAIAANENSCASGNMTIVRVNTITPHGSVAGFEKAVADHAKWYAAHGYAQDQIISAPVLVFDPATSRFHKSADTMMSFHYHSHDVPMEKQDKDWNSYVAEYRDNSDIKSTTFICLP